MGGRSSPRASPVVPRVVGRLGPSFASCSDSCTECGDDANENCVGDGESGPAATSGDSSWAPACLGNASPALPEKVEVDEGRDILVWVDVELWTE